MAGHIKFSDTQVAFAHLSDSELHRALFLFGSISHPTLAYVGPKLVQWGLSLRLPITPLIRGTFFAHFCGGENIQESMIRANLLAVQKVGTILDYSAEGKQSEEDFTNTEAEILQVIKQCSLHEHIRFAVFKLTGLCRFALLENISQGKVLTAEEQAEWQSAQNRVMRLCEAASAHDISLMMDAEETWIQGAIDEIIDKAMLRFNSQKAVVMNTYQMYLKSGLQRLQNAFDRAQKHGYHLGIKLVRGAYMEKERHRARELGYDSPVHENKKAVDHDYDQGLRLCINHIDHMRLCSGTHNEASTLLLCRLMEERGIASYDPRIEFSQLLGMSDHISYNLAHHGYNVSKYVPYGPLHDVMPYLFRRAEENSAIRGQSTRELNLLKAEYRRRQKSR